MLSALGSPFLAPLRVQIRRGFDVPPGPLVAPYKCRSPQRVVRSANLLPRGRPPETPLLRSAEQPAPAGDAEAPAELLHGRLQVGHVVLHRGDLPRELVELARTLGGSAVDP